MLGLGCMQFYVGVNGMNLTKNDDIIWRLPVKMGSSLADNTTVEPRFSGFLDYPDFFSSPNFVMNI